MKVKVESKSIYCYKCGIKIDKNEMYCSLISYSKGKVSHIDSWHARCHKEWIESKIEEGINNRVKSVYEIATNTLKSNLSLIN